MNPTVKGLKGWPLFWPPLDCRTHAIYLKIITCICAKTVAEHFKLLLPIKRVFGCFLTRDSCHSCQGVVTTWQQLDRLLLKYIEKMDKNSGHCVMDRAKISCHGPHIYMWPGWQLFFCVHDFIGIDLFDSYWKMNYFDY